MKASLAEADCALLVPRCDSAATVTLRFGAAEGFLARARGLIGRPPPLPGCGLLLRGVSAVHGFGMRYPIDLVFLDGQGVIVALSPLAPASIVRCSRARQVLEMRRGEIARLALRTGMRARLLPLHDIFVPQAGSCGGLPPQDPAHRAGDRRSFLFVVALGVGGMMAHAPSHPAEPPAGFAPVVPARLPAAGAEPMPETQPRAHPGSDSSRERRRTSRPPAVSAQTLLLLEAEAERLYREGPQETSDGELIEIYQALAELASDRSPQAWLRIGNIRQRAGGIGEAIDAYRRVRAPLAEQRLAAGETAGAAAATAAKEASSPKAGKVVAADATEGSIGPALAAERKALQNLAVLALDQARQALARLAALPLSPQAGGAPGEPEAGAPAGAAGPASGPSGRTAAVDSHRRQLESLERNLMAQQQRQAAVPAAATLASNPGDARMVERYTASARRNALKTARGSLHVDPADQLPASQIPRPRVSREEQLPSVEYLLGDPLRSRQAAESGEGSGSAGARAGKSPKREGASAANDQDPGVPVATDAKRGAAPRPGAVQR